MPLPLRQNKPFVRNHSYENLLCPHAHPHANQTYFLMKGFARRIVLKQRHKLTRKPPIRNKYGNKNHDRSVNFSILLQDTGNTTNIADSAKIATLGSSVFHSCILPMSIITHVICLYHTCQSLERNACRLSFCTFWKGVIPRTAEKTPEQFISQDNF